MNLSLGPFSGSWLGLSVMNCLTEHWTPPWLPLASLLPSTLLPCSLLRIKLINWVSYNTPHDNRISISISFNEAGHAVDGDHPSVQGEDPTALVLQQELGGYLELRSFHHLDPISDRDVVVRVSQLDPSGRGLLPSEGVGV